MQNTKRRFRPELRKAQIIEVTKKLILENGINGASLQRISSSLNITQNTLYYHFKNRQEILLETFKAVMTDILEPLTWESDDVIDFLYTSARMIYDQTINNPQQARLFFELLSSPLSDDFREEVQKQLTLLHSLFEAAIVKGVKQKVFRADTDTFLVGWEIMSLQLTTIIGSMVELPQFISFEQGSRALDLILGEIINKKKVKLPNRKV